MTQSNDQEPLFVDETVADEPQYDGEMETLEENLEELPVFGDAEDLSENVVVVPENELQVDWETVLQPVRESLDQIRSAQAQLSKDFSAKLKYDATKQEQIDKLYRDNQGLQESMIEKLKSQVLLAVIEQIDDAEKQISHFDKQDETERNYAKLLSCFRDVTVSFQDMLLERFDVSPFQSEPGTAFEPKRQRALKTTDTADESQNRTIAASLRPGYEKSDGTLVLRPEMVEVFRYNPALQTESQKNNTIIDQ